MIEMLNLNVQWRLVTFSFKHINFSKKYLFPVSGNNQICFDLPVDNLKTGKVRKVRSIFPTNYGELDIFQGGRVGKKNFTRGASCLEKGGELVEKWGWFGCGASCPDSGV